MADQKLKVLITGDASSLTRSLNTAKGKISAFGNRLSAIGSTLATRVSLPLALAGGAAVKMAIDMKESIMTMLKIAKEDPSDDLMNALFESFSMMKDLNTLEDFDRWARTILKGGPLQEGGINRTGALIRELEGVMTHGILSGPKTPVRAIMGTSSAVFLRPMAQMAGAALTGNGKIYREALADVNGMIQSIPESFKLFPLSQKVNLYVSAAASVFITLTI